MGLTDAIRLAAEQGCELVFTEDGRITIRSISYDSDPFELDQRRLLSLSREEFLSDWLPPRFEV